MDREFWEALRRHRVWRPVYRAASCRDHVVKMSKIDEIIQVANENDRYGEPLVFEEADADGRWMLYVAERHERRQAIATPRSHHHIWNSETQMSMSQYQTLTEALAVGNPHDAADGAEVDADQTLGFVHGQRRDAMQPESSSSSSSPDPVVRLPGPLIRNKSSSNVNTLASRDTPYGNSDVADRNKENNQAPRSFSETNGSGAFDSDSSDDEDMGAAAAAAAAADDAEQERIMQLFEDFPTCVQRARHLPATDSEEHGIMIISNPGSGWSHIDRARLPPRVQKYLADFTALTAATFPDSVYPNLALNGQSPRRWLLATARKEFVCDTSTLDELAADSAQKKRGIIQNSRDFQDGQGSRAQGNFRARPPRRRPPRGPRGLPRCDWQFWDEPDDTNRGPQIIVTESSGASHYLVDLDTFRLKVRQRRECRSGHDASYVEKSRMADRMEAMARFSAEEMEVYCDDEDSSLPSYTSNHSTRWWLRWGRMLFRPGAQHRPILPMYNIGSPSDPEKTNLLGHNDAQDERPYDETLGVVRPQGVVGALRNLACCCSKS